MYPILFRIFDFQIGTYGLLYAISFLTALRVATHYARKEGIDTGRILDLGIYTLLAGIVGAKLLLLLLDLPVYWDRPGELLRTWRAAGVFYGGLILASVVALFYAHRHRLPLRKTADVLAPALALGQAFGRVGCFAAGCCYGIPTRGFWSVTFRNPDARALTGVPLEVPLHPTQLYHSGANLLIFIILVFAYRRKRTDGTVFWLFLLLHALFRFSIEFLRGDFRGPSLVGGLTTSQGIALLAALLGGGMLLKYHLERESPQIGKK